MKSKSKQKSPVILIASISTLLIVAILGSVLYKYGVKEQSTENELTTQVDPTAAKQPIKDGNVEPADQKSETPNSEQPNKPISTPAENQTGDATNQLENGYVVGQKPATEPSHIKGVLIANKKYPLPSTYDKGEDPAARAAFEKMATGAKSEGFELVAFSGYRSYEYQTTLYDRYVSRDGKEAADRYSARPGHSEHQTGLAFDIGEKGREDLWLTSEFGETAAGKWLKENAYKYGFILRYPKGKEEITGFMYESWHFRYLEGDLSTKVHEAGVTLEEYLEIE